ncbi:MAG: alpha/beta hydrolase [Beijerinckiaceae bacterium]
MTFDLEAEYNNRARVPEHPAIIAAWVKDAADYRAACGSRLSRINYGPRERQIIDVFAPEKPDPKALPVMFIHGGYWQSLDPSFFSHLAKGLNAHGITVCMAGYDLCPDVGMAEIVEQMMDAAKTIHRTFKKPLVVTGHSAGGHLAACLVATDWREIDPKLPANMTSSGLALSGLFELEPLVPTSVNTKLGLDIQAARALSPRLWVPPKDRTFDMWVGGDESQEYHRQSQTLAAVWQASGNRTEYVSLAGTNHFTVINPLAEAGSALTQRIAAIALGLK